MKQHVRYSVILAAVWTIAAAAGMNVGADSFQGEEISKGSRVEFGEYPQQDDSEDRDPVIWEVLTAEDGRALLLCETCLEGMPYHMSREDITWEDCSLRTWLNSEFFMSAFDADEQDLILEETLESDSNVHYETEGGNSTEDKVFILSHSEAEEYFAERNDRTAQASVRIAKENDDDDDSDEDDKKDKDDQDSSAESSDEGSGDKDDNSDAPDRKTVYVSDVSGNCFWWLRTPGETLQDAECVGAEGSFLLNGYDVTQIDVGVRPAIWVKTGK